MQIYLVICSDIDIGVTCDAFYNREEALSCAKEIANDRAGTFEVEATYSDGSDELATFVYFVYTDNPDWVKVISTEIK